jgi:hypothetical protein
MKQNIQKKIKSMTAKEIVMSMVNGLRNPVTQINMDTYGEVVEGVCFGCAATNALCYIGNYSTEDLLKVDGSATLVEKKSIAMRFEWAIDELRKGDIDSYNYHAAEGGFAKISLPDGLDEDDLMLPYLANDYTEAELECYVKLAEML